MSDDTLPIIHAGPWTEGYRREVMAKHGVDPGIEAGLPPLPPLEPWRPTRDEVRACKADLAYTPVEGMNSEWQTYAAAGWTREKQVAWLQQTRGFGGTHGWVQPVCRYPNAGADFDLRRTPDGHAAFRDFLDLMYEHRVIPMVALQGGEGGSKYRGQLDDMRADVDAYADRGWLDRIVCWTPGPEADDFMTAATFVGVARHMRAVKPESYLYAHVGRNGDGLYIGNDAEGYDRFRFWDELRGVVDCLAFEPTLEAIDDPDPERTVFIKCLGAACRIHRYIERDEAQAIARGVGYTLTRAELDDITHSYPYAGGGWDLTLFEQGAYRRWSSARKARLSALAMRVPGFVGYGDGVPTAAVGG